MIMMTMVMVMVVSTTELTNLWTSYKGKEDF
jgi:hypothetical protein